MASGKPKRCDWCGTTKGTKKPLKIGNRPKTKLPLYLDLCPVCYPKRKAELEKDK